MARGRPLGSQVRENLVEVLHVLKKGHGYELHGAYIKVFPAVTMRNIYYHLKKGVEIGVFKVKKVELHAGDYSWGPDAQRTYYALGPRARPKKLKRVRDALKE